MVVTQLSKENQLNYIILEGTNLINNFLADVVDIELEVVIKYQEQLDEWVKRFSRYKYKRKAVILMKKVRWFFEYGIRISVKLVTSYLILIIIPLIILGVVLYSFYLDAFIVQASKYSNQLMNQINRY